jgi:hypothetical protein
MRSITGQTRRNISLLKISNVGRDVYRQLPRPPLSGRALKQVLTN